MVLDVPRVMTMKSIFLYRDWTLGQSGTVREIVEDNFNYWKDEYKKYKNTLPSEEWLALYKNYNLVKGTKEVPVYHTEIIFEE